MRSILNTVKKLLKFLSHNNQGYALPIVLVMLSLLVGTGVYLVNRNMGEMEANQKSHDYEICLLTGQNAMEEVKALISSQEPVLKGSAEDPNGGVYSYELFKSGENNYEGSLESSYRYYQKKFRLEVEIDPEKEGVIKNFFWEME